MRRVLLGRSLKCTNKEQYKKKKNCCFAPILFLDLQVNFGNKSKTTVLKDVLLMSLKRFILRLCIVSGKKKSGFDEMSQIFQMIGLILYR